MTSTDSDVTQHDDCRRVGDRRGSVRRGGHAHCRHGGTEHPLPRAGRLGQPQRLPRQPPRVGTAHPARLGARSECPCPAVRLPGRRDGIRHVARDVQRRRGKFHLLRRGVAAAAALGLPGQDARRCRGRLADQLRRPQAVPRRGRRIHRRLRSRRRHRLPRGSRIPAAATPVGQARHESGRSREQARLALVAGHQRDSQPEEQDARAVRALGRLRMGLPAGREGLVRLDLHAAGAAGRRPRGDRCACPPDRHRRRRPRRRRRMGGPRPAPSISSRPGQ